MNFILIYSHNTGMWANMYVFLYYKKHIIKYT